MISLTIHLLIAVYAATPTHTQLPIGVSLCASDLPHVPESPPVLLLQQVGTPVGPVQQPQPSHGQPGLLGKLEALLIALRKVLRNNTIELHNIIQVVHHLQSS